jgi:hypothetical protein
LKLVKDISMLSILLIWFHSGVCTKYNQKVTIFHMDFIVQYDKVLVNSAVQIGFDYSNSEVQYSVESNEFKCLNEI